MVYIRIWFIVIIKKPKIFENVFQEHVKKHLQKNVDGSKICKKHVTTQNLVL